jgi:hypothetical protein
LAQDRIAATSPTVAEQRAADAEVTAVEVASASSSCSSALVVLGVTVTRSISRPCGGSPGPRRRWRTSAGRAVRVADSDSSDQAPVQLASVEVDSADEIGELATALNRVQATAALLLERQVTTRNNVAVMFANIARRTQNLVGRQLTLIDELERNERDPELLQRLYRLDHVATRLRRSADSLLVVSGTIDQQRQRYAHPARRHRPVRAGRDRGVPRRSSWARWPTSRSTPTSSPTCACCWPSCSRTRRTSPRRGTRSR